MTQFTSKENASSKDCFLIYSRDEFSSNSMGVEKILRFLDLSLFSHVSFPLCIAIQMAQNFWSEEHLSNYSHIIQAHVQFTEKTELWALCSGKPQIKGRDQ
jgi:hypothetical protein